MMKGFGTKNVLPAFHNSRGFSRRLNHPRVVSESRVVVSESARLLSEIFGNLSALTKVKKRCHVHTHTHTRTQTHACMRRHTHRHAHVCTHTHTHTHRHVHVCARTHTHTQTHTCMHTRKPGKDHSLVKALYA